MARTIVNPKLKNRTNRLALPLRRKPYSQSIAPHTRLCYRRNEGPGTWSVEANGSLKRFGLADDHEAANNETVFSYHEAVQQALKIVRGAMGDHSEPVTVAMALDAYESDLKTRGGGKANATTLRHHCSKLFLGKLVGMLSEHDLVQWRADMLAEGLKVSSVNRIAKSLKACLSLAARRDKRITNKAAWANALRALETPEGETTGRENYVLPDQTINALVRECYVEGEDFGALIEALAVTGCRESQLLRLMPADLVGSAEAPSLMIPCSRKGKRRVKGERRKIAITPKLAKVLGERAVKNGPNKPLLERLWNMAVRLRVPLKRLGLDESLTCYTFRHSSIVRQIRANVPVRIIAFAHDTSVHEIEATYARFLDEAANDLTRAGLLMDTPAVSNVIPMQASAA